MTDAPREVAEALDDNDDEPLSVPDAIERLRKLIDRDPVMYPLILDPGEFEREALRTLTRALSHPSPEEADDAR